MADGNAGQSGHVTIWSVVRHGSILWADLQANSPLRTVPINLGDPTQGNYTSFEIVKGIGDRADTFSFKRGDCHLGFRNDDQGEVCCRLVNRDQNERDLASWYFVGDSPSSDLQPSFLSIRSAKPGWETEFWFVDADNVIRRAARAVPPRLTHAFFCSAAQDRWPGI
jgi:hypothetical protein